MTLYHGVALLLVSAGVSAVASAVASALAPQRYDGHAQMAGFCLTFGIGLLFMLGWP